MLSSLRLWMALVAVWMTAMARETSAIFVSDSHPFLKEYTYCNHYSLGPWGGVAPFNLTIHSGWNTTKGEGLLETLLLNSAQTSISNWVVDVPAQEKISFLLEDRSGSSLTLNAKVGVSHLKCDQILLRNIKYDNASVVLIGNNGSSGAPARTSAGRGVAVLAVVGGAFGMAALFV